MDNGVHILPLRVYYEDTDAAGIVYHANYLRFAERARTEFLRMMGANHSEMRAATGAAFAVRDCRIEYFIPAVLDDALEVRTRMLAVSGATLRAEQSIWRGETEIARLNLRIACIGPSMRPTRVPRDVRTALSALSTASEPRSEEHGG
ncbi:MAG: tol-pal system-associated acyl-CoA thioesterase [Rhodospirillaceae bacterium]|nr:tol-pal system-associated acyl-CoA thioesterase [Rhodospirillaceae bacterium]